MKNAVIPKTKGFTTKLSTKIVIKKFYTAEIRN
jgi:hypothetical protein